MGVQRKTNYLVVGHILDDGRAPEEGKKYQTAVKYKTLIMNEGDFEKFCQMRF